MRRLLSSGLLLLSTYFAYSDEQSIEDRVSYLEKKQGYGYKHENYQVVLLGEFLYWRADVDGVTSATTSFTQETVTGSVQTEIKAVTPDFSFDPGFRLSGGIQLPYDLVDVMGVWTRFNTTGHKKVHGSLVTGVPTGGEKVVFGNIGLIEQLSSIPTEAKTQCTIHTDLIEVQMGRGISASYHFFIRPYFGARAIWSSVDWKMALKRNFVIPDTTFQDSSVLKVDHHFQAVGGLIGMEMDFQAYSGFGVHIRGAASLVWGPAEERTKQNYNYLPANTTSVLEETFTAKNRFQALKSMVELFLGLSWKVSLSKHPITPKTLLVGTRGASPSLRFLVGYEFQDWPYIAQKTTIQENRERERFNLGFQGLVGGLQLIF